MGHRIKGESACTYMWIQTEIESDSMNRETSHVPIQQTCLHVYVCQKNVIMIAARDIVFNCSIEIMKIPGG